MFWGYGKQVLPIFFLYSSYIRLIFILYKTFEIGRNDGASGEVSFWNVQAGCRVVIWYVSVPFYGGGRVAA